MSFQRHHFRAEFWKILEGIGELTTALDNDGKDLYIHRLDQFSEFRIHCHQWHTIKNISDATLTIAEIQYGIDCREDDIERKELIYVNVQNQEN